VSRISRVIPSQEEPCLTEREFFGYLALLWADHQAEQAREQREQDSECASTAKK